MGVFHADLHHKLPSGASTIHHGGAILEHFDSVRNAHDISHLHPRHGIQNVFLAGLLITLPITLTIFILNFLFKVSMRYLLFSPTGWFY
jgi:hypothetical protein